MEQAELLRKVHVFTDRDPEKFWSDQEKKQLIKGLKLHGKNWDKIAEHVGDNKTQKQI